MTGCDQLISKLLEGIDLLLLKKAQHEQIISDRPTERQTVHLKRHRLYIQLYTHQKLHTGQFKSKTTRARKRKKEENASAADPPT